MNLPKFCVADRPITHGDIISIDGVYAQIPNPSRSWLTFWRPRLVQSGELQRFEVVETFRHG